MGAQGTKLNQDFLKHNFRAYLSFPGICNEKLMTSYSYSFKPFYVLFIKELIEALFEKQRTGY
jgi:hypothetical protein